MLELEEELSLIIRYKWINSITLKPEKCHENKFNFMGWPRVLPNAGRSLEAEVETSDVRQVPYSLIHERVRSDTCCY